VDPKIAAFVTITGYADDNGANTTAHPEPTAQNYTTIGVTGIGGAGQPSLEMVNSALKTAGITGANVDTTGKVQAIVAACQLILDNAANKAAAPDLTQAQYELLGITNIDKPYEVSLLGNVIDSKNTTDVNTVQRVQDLADAVQHVMDGTPSQAELTLLGVTNVTANNLKAIQAALASADDAKDLNTLTGLQGVVSKAASAYNTALAKIQDYAQDNSKPAPSAQDYKDIGIPGVTQDNLAAVNSKIDASDRAGTSSPALVLQLVDDGIKAQQAALQKIADYADNNTTNPAPTVDDYKTAGIQGVTAANKDAVNTSIANATREQADTVLEVQGRVNSATSGNADTSNAAKLAALAKITAYADNGSNPAPSAKDYQDAGVTGVTQDNLTAVNAKVDAANKTDADTVRGVQNLADQGKADQEGALAVITAYATNSANPAPTVDTYKTAGIQGVTAANLAAANTKVDSVEALKPTPCRKCKTWSTTPPPPTPLTAKPPCWPRSPKSPPTPTTPPTPRPPCKTTPMQASPASTAQAPAPHNPHWP